MSTVLYINLTRENITGTKVTIVNETFFKTSLILWIMANLWSQTLLTGKKKTERQTSCLATESTVCDSELTHILKTCIYKYVLVLMYLSMLAC